MPPIVFPNPKAARNGRAVPIRHQQSFWVHGVELSASGDRVVGNRKFARNDHLNVTMKRSGVKVTCRADNDCVFFKTPAGAIETWHYEIVHGWTQLPMPQCSELPKQSLYEKAYLFFLGSHGQWVNFTELPWFGAAIEFDAAAGTVRFIDMLGSWQTVKLADAIGQTYDIDCRSSRVLGNWQLVVCEADRVNIYCSDEDLGHVERILLSDGKSYHHALLEPLSFDKVTQLGLMYRPGGKLILADGAVPLVLDVFNSWKLYFSENTWLQSFGDGHLLDNRDGKLHDTYYSQERDRYYYFNSGWRVAHMPWIMDCGKTQSTTVCNGAITLYYEGSCQVFGQMISSCFESFSVYGPGGVHAFRSPGSDTIYVCEGNYFRVFAKICGWKVVSN